MTRRLGLLAAVLVAVVGFGTLAGVDAASAASGSLTGSTVTIEFGSDSNTSVTVAPSGSNLVFSGVSSGTSTFPAASVDTIVFTAADPVGSGNFIIIDGTTPLTVGQGIDNQTTIRTTLKGSITMTAGGFSTLGNTVLSEDTTLTTGGLSTFGGTIASAAVGTPRALTLAGTSGSATFKGNVSGLTTYSAGGTTTFAGAAAITMTSTGAQTFTGGIVNGSGHTATTLTASTITSAGPITSTAASTVTMTTTSDLSLAGEVAGAVTIAKTGTNKLTLARANSTTGGFDISGGELLVTHAGALGAGTVTLRASTTLTLSGGLTVSSPSSIVIAGTGIKPVIRGTGGTTRLSVPISLTSAMGFQVGELNNVNTFELNGAITGTSGYGQNVEFKGAGVSVLQPVSGLSSLVSTVPTTLAANVGSTAQEYYGLTTITSNVTLSLAFLVGTGDFVNGTVSTKTLTLSVADGAFSSTAYTGRIGGYLTTADQKAINVAKTGGGAIVLGGDSSYTGTTTISAGELTVASATALGTGAATVSGTATLSIRNGVDLTGVPSIAISGPGRGVWKGALHAVSATGAPGEAVVTQPITLAGNATIGGDYNATLVVSGGITGGGNTLSLSGWTKLHSAVTGLSSVTTTSDAYETWLDRSITTTGAQNYSGTVYLENSLTLTATGLTGNGEFLNATGSSKTLTLDLSGNSEFQGQIATPGSTDAKRTLNLVKAGAGQLTLAVNSSAPIGSATISNGSVVISGSLIPTADLIVSPGATLFGSGGNLGHVVLGTNGAPSPSTGTFDLGRGATPQVANATGFTGASTAALKLELDGPDVTYSKLIVSGTVNLADTMLYATVGATPQPGDRYTIIDNTGTGAINGTFLGVAEGDRVVLDTYQFVVSYRGGDGNDVTLTYYGAAPTISGISPASGPTAGSTPVTISGTGFGRGAVVTIGGAACIGVSVAADHLSLTCTTGAHAAGAADISITNIDGQSVTRTGAFTFVAPPVPTPTPTAAATPAATSPIAKPTVNAATGTVSNVVIATGPGSATLRVTVAGSVRAATGCTVTKTVKKAGRITLSCKLPAAVRTAMRTKSVKLAITTTWAPKSGKPTTSATTVTAKR